MSGLARRNTGSRVPYLAASWRREQNLGLYDGLAQDEQRRFKVLMGQCKSLWGGGMRRLVV